MEHGTFPLAIRRTKEQHCTELLRLHTGMYARANPRHLSIEAPTYHAHDMHRSGANVGPPFVARHRYFNCKYLLKELEKISVSRGFSAASLSVSRPHGVHLVIDKKSRHVQCGSGIIREITATKIWNCLYLRQGYTSIILPTSAQLCDVALQLIPRTTRVPALYGGLIRARTLSLGE